MTKSRVLILFEENASYYAMAYEILKRKEKDTNYTLVIFGGSIPKSLNNQRAWVTYNGGFFQNLNGIKYVLRYYVTRVFTSRKPSNVLVKSLEKSAINIMDLTGVKFRSEKARYFKESPAFTKESHSLFRKIFLECAGEIYGTDHIEKYLKQNQIDEYLNSMRVVKQILGEILLRTAPSEVEYMNGRFLYERVLLEVCKELKIESVAFESSINGRKIQKYSGASSNLIFLNEEIERFWESFSKKSGKQTALDIAEKYFVERKMRQQTNPFLGNMKHEVKVAKEEDAMVYTYFTSSNEELRSVYSLRGEQPPDQHNLIENLISVFNEQKTTNHKLYIRVHPNMNNKKKTDREFYEKLSSSAKVTIIACDSGVNSYSLLSQSDVVLTLASTVGLEAAFFEIPTLTFGKTFWSGLNLSQEINDAGMVFQTKSLPTNIAKLQAAKYVVFGLESGEEYKFIDIERLSTKDGRFYFDIVHWLLGKVNFF